MDCNREEQAFLEDMSADLFDLNCDLDFADSWEIEPVPESEGPHPVLTSSRKLPRKRTVKKSGSTQLVSKVSRRQLLSQQSDSAPRLVFPSFIKSNATLHFASTFAKLSNIGDMNGLQQLATTHCVKDINVRLHPEFSVPLATFLDIFSAYLGIKSDYVSCVHSTTIVGDTITAVLYHKATDVAEMYAYHDCAVDEKLKWLFVGERRAIFDRKYKLPALKESTRDAIYGLIESKASVQVYGRVDISLTLHPRSKKFVDFAFISKYTSICHDNVHYSLL